MIKQKDITKWQAAKRHLADAEEKIINRIDEVIRIICDHYGVKLETWYFYDAPEGGMGTLYINDIIEFVLDTDLPLPSDFSTYIPVDFLFISNDEIIKKLDE